MDRQSRQMTTRRLRLSGMAATTLVLGGLAAAAVAVGPAGATTSRVAKTVALTAVKTSKGTVLASGKTLYTLKPSATPCTAACLKVWPALVLPKGASKPKVGSGVSSSKIGAVTRNGVRQVTYGGKPLYTFVGDMSPGQVNGNVTDAWGKWTAVVTAKGSSASGSSSGGSSSGGSSSGGSTAGSGGTAF